MKGPKPDRSRRHGDDDDDDVVIDDRQKTELRRRPRLAPKAQPAGDDEVRVDDEPGDAPRRYESPAPAVMRFVHITTGTICLVVLILTTGVVIGSIAAPAAPAVPAAIGAISAISVSLIAMLARLIGKKGGKRR